MVVEIYTKFFPDQYTHGLSNATTVTDKGTQETAECEEVADKGAEHKETTAQQDYGAVHEVIQELNIDEIQAEEQQKNDMSENVVS
ncbi:hypothetical protein PanWU01x14_050800 [Parasponia andersonii]|uniref:Uncharacterized protein n=1 Tax=Parasponia andersonii TaxID=3476 RepID=A0A2P5DLU1_PARAD|nr:hypothetical protein PanWU01x14_050800 [Parasponia andersonii]